MPAGAPPLMQFQPMQFAQAPDNSKQLDALKKAIPGALGQQGLGSLLQQPGVPGTPGAAVPGAQGPTSYGSPTTGPMPLQPPGAGAPVAPPAASPFPNPVGAPGPSITDITRTMTPPQLLSWLQTTSRTGQPLAAGLPGGGLPVGTGLPGAPAMPPWMTGAGMLPGG